MSEFVHDSLRLHYEVRGTGAPVLLLHGGSERPHDPTRYGTANLARDARALLDHLGLARASLVAYSIGTAVALGLMQSGCKRFDRAVLVATGDGLLGHPPHRFDDVLPHLAKVFERTGYPRDLPKHQSAYWKILEAVGGDRPAQRRSRSRAKASLRRRARSGT